MTETNSYKIVKLINGEDIICTMHDGSGENQYEVRFPLKMQVIPKMTPHGMSEALNLSYWVHPYTESHSFNIPSSSVIVVTDVSPGLSRYYEFVLKKMNESNEIIDPSNDEIYDELLEELDVDSDILH